ncbi:hypothetical protein COCCADRAFT_39304 [Bipolaris zeicola 26-R-13]|uniref:Uncharacterized protein n=1 Tax=Cochliobolus carbonum (strain 26-R-13) TaxID=930089 RepID=W6XXJ8_COCC2|nr:uncharacterized protein COCCADRAFT_39304 [Bipolaris zeicola 26-R-13]EUC30488.1 hypothetical protein COCCADRAFT_39304 [Bipolaris zeicola 26-R-13]
MKGPGSTVHYPLSWCPIRKRRDTATAHESALKQTGAYTSFSSSFLLAFTWSSSHCNKPIRARCAHPCQRQIRITRHLDFLFFVAIITLISLSRRIISNENTAPTTPKAKILRKGNMLSIRYTVAEIPHSNRCTRHIGSFCSDSHTIPICEDA